MPFPILNVFSQSSFNVSSGSIFVYQSPEKGVPFPPTPGNFLLLDGTDFLLLDGTNLLLL